jgi:ketosteroid isomerase-like protein
VVDDRDAGVGNETEVNGMTEDRSGFAQFMQQREKAAQAYVSGDPGPLGGIVTRTLPATFFGPGGGHSTGADGVRHAFEDGAAAFEPGGETHFEIFDLAAGDEVAYWVGVQRATVRVAGRSEPVPMDLRVTEVFRREHGGWKLVHRHADQLVSPA